MNLFRQHNSKSVRLLAAVVSSITCLSALHTVRAYSANPVNPAEESQQHITAGANAAAEGDWKAALREFLTAAAKDTHSEKALYHVGIAYYHLGRLEQAKVAEILAIQANSKFLPAYLELATIQTKMNKYDDAKSILEEGLKIFPGNAELLTALAGVSKVETKAATESAVKPAAVPTPPMAKSALLYNAKNIAGLLKESDLAFRHGDLKKAKDALGLAMRLAPKKAEPHWRMCQILSAEGNTAEAIAAAKKAVALEPKNPKWYLALGWAYSRAGKWPDSFDAFQEAFKRDNNLHDAIVGECYALAKQKQVTLARITLHVSDPEAHDTSWYHAANGLILEEKGDLVEAYKELQHACDIAPNDYQVRYTLARVSYQLACTEKTRDRWKESAQHSRELLTATPSDVEVLINLGIAQSALNENGAAIETLAKAVKISPTNASAHAAYASVLAAAGRNDEAVAEAKLAKKINPTQKLADTVLQRLK